MLALNMIFIIEDLQSLMALTQPSLSCRAATISPHIIHDRQFNGRLPDNRRLGQPG